jgi:glutamine amidotransferase
MTFIAIIDHGAGNLVSISEGLQRAGAKTRMAVEPQGLQGADAVVLPGVGSMGAAMRRLTETGLDDAVRRWKGPLMGICVGLQLFFGASDEAGSSGLGLLDGPVRKLRAERLPHMGWNDISRSDDPIFMGIPDHTPFYFVHGYAPEPVDPGLVIGTTEYGDQDIVAAVRSEAIVGVQFHPERSGARGMQILANFVRSCRSASRAP